MSSAVPTSWGGVKTSDSTAESAGLNAPIDRFRSWIVLHGLGGFDVSVRHPQRHLLTTPVALSGPRCEP